MFVEFPSLCTIFCNCTNPTHIYPRYLRFCFETFSCY